MEMKVVIDGLGLSIPKTGLGLKLFSGTYIQMRNSKDSHRTILGLVDAISIGE